MKKFGRLAALAALVLGLSILVSCGGGGGGGGGSGGTGGSGSSDNIVGAWTGGLGYTDDAFWAKEDGTLYYLEEGADGKWHYDSTKAGTWEKNEKGTFDMRIIAPDYSATAGGLGYWIENGKLYFGNPNPEYDYRFGPYDPIDLSNLVDDAAS